MSLNVEGSGVSVVSADDWLEKYSSMAFCADTTIGSGVAVGNGFLVLVAAGLTVVLLILVVGVRLVFVESLFAVEPIPIMIPHTRRTSRAFVKPFMFGLLNIAMVAMIGKKKIQRNTVKQPECFSDCTGVGSGICSFCCT